jgi:hypothetical protein
VFWRLLGRLILVPLGFVLALLISALVLGTLGLERLTHTIYRRDVVIDDWFKTVQLAQDTVGLLSTITLVPALALVIIGEVARIRSSLYYILGGGLVLAAWPFMSRFAKMPGDPTQLADLWTVFATAGFAGGFIYWLIAGRNA